MKQIIENLQVALDVKTAIFNKYLNKQEPYYYKEQVTVKHKPKILGLVKDNPYYTTHIEIRYNQELFEKDFTKAHAEVDKYERQIALHTKQLEEDLKKVYIQKQQEEKTFNKLESMNLQIEQEIKNAENQHILLEQEYAPLEKQYNELESSIDDLNIQLEGLSHIPEITNNPVSEIDNVIQNFNGNKKAMLLFNLWGKEDDDSLEMIDSIINRGFDVDYQNKEGITLLQKAASLNDIKLLEIVLVQDAKSAEEKTLLNYALENSNDEFVVNLLSAQADFTYGVGYIVKEDILKSFQRLLIIKPEVINEPILSLVFQTEEGDIKSEITSKTKSFNIILSNALENNADNIVEQMAIANKHIVADSCLDEVYLEKLVEVLSFSKEPSLNKIAAEYKVYPIPQILSNIPIEDNKMVSLTGGGNKIEDGFSEGENEFTEFDNF